MLQCRDLVGKQKEMTVSRTSKALPSAEEIWDLDKEPIPADKPPVLKASVEASTSRKGDGDKSASIGPKK